MAQAASATASTPAPAPVTQQEAPTLVSSSTATAAAWFTGIGGILTIIFLFVFHFGAAKLSYDLNQSFGWGFLSFIFASVYYPYYAFVHSTRRSSSILSSIVGGRRRR